jgi:DNA repair protein RadC
MEKYSSNNEKDRKRISKNKFIQKDDFYTGIIKTNETPIEFSNTGIIKMKELPSFDRPYEKLEFAGEKSLTDTELLAILIKNGNREISAMTIAQKIMQLDDQKKGVSFLCNIPVEDLKKINGIGRVKSIIIKAALELGRRASRTTPVLGETIIKSPSDIVDFINEEMQLLPCEEIRVVLLDNKNAIMKIIKSATGSVNETLFSPREIFKDALRYNASSVILIHNHPSGNPKPSDSDLRTTAELSRIGKELGIQILDHIVIGRNGYESISSIISMK